MKLKYLSHGGFSFEYNGKHILLDPFLTGNPLAEGIDPSLLPADYILLTHAHGDHTADVVSIANRTKATIVSNYEVATYYQGKGLNAHPMNHGGKWKFDFGTVKYVNAVHSSTFPDNSPGGNPGGFVIWGGDKTIYFAGDTALTYDMKLIPLTCPKLDFCVLPIGDNFTMGYEDAVLAAQFVACNRVIGCHYDTFGYIEIDHHAARSAFESKGIELLLPNINEHISL